MKPVVAPRAWEEPRRLFPDFARRPYCVWLDSATTGRYSILAAEPAEIFRSKGSQVEIITPQSRTALTGNPFAHLAGQLARWGTSSEHPFPTGAAIGYCAYDLKHFTEKLPATAVDDVGLPDCWFGFYDELLVFDHREQQVWEIGGRRGATAWPQQACRSITSSDFILRSNFTREEYCAAVRRAQEYIAAGDIYQVNLSQRFQCDLNASPVEVYRALRETNPAPYCAYLDIGEAQILSSSPECFLNLTGRHAVTRPIKGTRPRAADPDELLRSPKDNAELLMITDLERNDLGRVCEFGSVRVSELKRVETYATVHHLVSTVEGTLRPAVSHLDCLRACFPGGSITGAPKIRAMEIIDELEPHARGVYTGAIGFFGFNNLAHFNIAIRTVVQQDGKLTFHAGGGIVADSDADAEYHETLAKAQGIINAIDQLRLRQRPVRA